MCLTFWWKMPIRFSNRYGDCLFLTHFRSRYLVIAKLIESCHVDRPSAWLPWWDLPSSKNGWHRDVLNPSIFLIASHRIALHFIAHDRLEWDTSQHHMCLVQPWCKFDRRTESHSQPISDGAADHNLTSQNQSSIPFLLFGGLESARTGCWLWWSTETGMWFHVPSVSMNIINTCVPSFLLDGWFNCIKLYAHMSSINTSREILVPVLPVIFGSLFWSISDPYDAKHFFSTWNDLYRQTFSKGLASFRSEMIPYFEKTVGLISLQRAPHPWINQTPIRDHLKCHLYYDFNNRWINYLTLKSTGAVGLL